MALIPALDEAASLPLVLAALREAGVHEVVVVDNGSTDATPEVARSGGAEVVHACRRGYGSACLAGLAHLAPDPPDIILFVDADHGADPCPLRIVLAPVLAGEVAMSIGARQGAADAPRRQRGGTWLITRLAGLLFGARLADLGPLRAVRWTALDALALDDPTWGWTLQMQLRAHRLNLSVREVPVPRSPRPAGRSKISGSVGRSLRVGLRMLRVLLAERVRS